MLARVRRLQGYSQAALARAEWAHHRYWSMLRKLAGRPGFDFYELRHAAATMLLEPASRRGTSSSSSAIPMEASSLLSCTGTHPRRAPGLRSWQHGLPRMVPCRFERRRANQVATAAMKGLHTASIDARFAAHFPCQGEERRMSYEVVLRPTEARARVRNPWGVLGLSIITLGIYLPFWWYFINREMRDLGRSRRVRDLGDSPGLSVLAFTLGWVLIVPAIWTLVTTCQRIYRADRHMGREDPLNGWIVLLLFILLGIFVHVYMQYQLNKAWQSDEMEALQASGASGQLDEPGSG